MLLCGYLNWLVNQFFYLQIQYLVIFSHNQIANPLYSHLEMHDLGTLSAFNIDITFVAGFSFTKFASIALATVKHKNERKFCYKFSYPDKWQLQFAQ